MSEWETASLNRRRFLELGIGVAASSALASRPVSAQDAYPSRPVEVVVPFAPGGSGDAATRLIQDGMLEVLKQPLVVINRPGAGTNIGMQAVANAEPDGYTLLMAATALTTNQALFEKLPFDPLNDLAPISNVINSPLILVANPSLPAKNLSELITYLKAHPGDVSYGSSGVGASTHIGGELFKKLTGTDILHVPYSGGGQSVVGASSKSGVQLLFSNIVTVRGAITSGALRPIALASSQRSPLIPDVPTFIEQGLDYRFGSWFGLLAPAKTPRPVIDKLSTAVRQVLARPEVIAAAHNQGGEPVGNTPEEFGHFLQDEAKRLQALIREAGIRAE